MLPGLKDFLMAGRRLERPDEGAKWTIEVVHDLGLYRLEDNFRTHPASSGR